MLVENVVHAGLKTWYMLMIYTNFPLNLNLIIPFKDKKGIRGNRLLLELKKYEEQLHQRAVDLKAELLTAFKSSFGLSITK